MKVLIGWITPIVLLGLLALWSPAQRDITTRDQDYWHHFQDAEIDYTNTEVRWTTDASVIRFPASTIGQQLLTFQLRNGRDVGVVVPVVLQVEQQQPFTVEVGTGLRAYHILADATQSGHVNVQISAPPFQPSKVDVRSQDTRTLGVLVQTVSVRALPGEASWWWLVVLAFLLQATVLWYLLRLWRAPSGMQQALLWLWLPVQLPLLLVHSFPRSNVVAALTVLIVLLGAAVASYWLVPLYAGAQSPRVVVRRKRVGYALLVSVPLLIYLAVAFVVPLPERVTTTTGDEMHYLLMAHSLFHDHDIDLLNNYEQRDYQDFFEMELTPALVTFKGRIVPAHPRLGLPLVVLPFYAFGGRAAVLLFLSVCMAGALVWLCQVATRFVPLPAALFGILLLGVTYPTVIYSHQIYPDTLGFVAAAFVLAQAFFPAQHGQHWQAFGVGLVLGFLPLCHYKLAVLSAALYLFFLWKRRSRLGSTLLWSAPTAAAMALLLVWSLYRIYGEITPAIFATQTAGDFSGQAITAPVLRGAGVVGLFFDQANGLFFYASLYLLAFVGVWVGVRNRHTRADIIGLLLVYACYHLFVGVWRGWIGGAAPVPRQIIPVLPILMLFTTVGLYTLWKRREWVILGGLMWLQLFITALIVEDRYLAFGIYNALNPLLRDVFDAPDIALLLPSFLKSTAWESYGLLCVLLVGLLLVLALLLQVNKLFISSKRR